MRNRPKSFAPLRACLGAVSSQLLHAPGLAVFNPIFCTLWSRWIQPTPCTLASWPSEERRRVQGGGKGEEESRRAAPRAAVLYAARSGCRWNPETKIDHFSRKVRNTRGYQAFGPCQSRTVLRVVCTSFHTPCSLFPRRACRTRSSWCVRVYTPPSLALPWRSGIP